MVEDFNVPGTTAQVRALAPGENITKATFIPAFRFNPDRVKDTKRSLTQNVSPAIDRVKREFAHREFRTHTIHAFTRDYDVVVAVVIQRTDRGETTI